MKIIFRRFRLLYAFLFILILTGFTTLVKGQARPTQEEVNVEKKLIEGKKYQLLGDLDKAESIFKSILIDDVNNTAAYYELSRTLTAKGSLQDALVFIRKAIRLEPENEWFLLMEADIHEKITDLYSAMDIYDRLLQLRPDRTHYYEIMISFCKKTGENERLLNVLDKYETITGLNEAITRTRFEALDALGRTNEALAAIHRLTEMYPNNIDYKFLAASYCKTKGLDDKAALYYKQILEIDPTDSRARLAMAGSEKKEGDNVGYLQSIIPIINNPGLKIDVKLQELIPYVLEYSEKKDAALGNALLEVIQQLIKTHPKEAKSFAIKADVLSIMGKKSEAVDAYITSTTMNGNIYVVWEQMIKLLIETYRYDDVISRANNAIDIFPNQAYLYYAVGYASYKKKHFDEALDMLNQALIMTGKNIQQRISVYNVLGMVYDELGQADKSVEAFETALSINPKSAETLSQYSLVLSRRIEQSAKAIDMAEKVLASGNQSAVVHQWIAEVFYNQKKYDKANQSIQVAVKEGTDAYGYNLAGDILIAIGETDKALDMWQKAMNQGYPDQEVKRKIAEHKTP
ncbi:MAG TPA: tetratricopeptide repeat protein [Saprospiraceae bacterium]|nr:tetratricopeptide repeat protein [Saprospiraceae bacterium]